MKAKDIRKATRGKVRATMHEFKVGELHSWGGPKKPKGKKVTDRRQAIAIALSQARQVETDLRRKRGWKR